MLALVFVQVDELGGGADGLEGGFFHPGRGADKGDHRAIVVRVGADAEDAGAWYPADGLGDGVVHFRPAAVAKIGDTFNDLLHGNS